MINEQDLKRFYFKLNESKPIQVIVNQHEDSEEGWFDMHYELEVGLVTKGRMKREYFGHEMEIGPGEVWLCGMWEPHGFELLETPCEVVVFVIDPRYIAGSNFLNRNVLAPFTAEPKLRPQTPFCSIEAVKELADKSKSQFTLLDDPDWAKLHLFQLLLILMEKWTIPDNQTDHSFDSRESIHQALKLVFEERRLITTEEAASVCHLSVSNFRSHFKTLMGTTFSDFALHYRIRGAAAQLKNSSLTQEAVATNWGFTDASHLHKYISRGMGEMV